MNHLHEEFPEAMEANPLPSFEQLANMGLSEFHPQEMEVREAIATGKQPRNVPIRTDSFGFESIHQAIAVLFNAGVERVEAYERPRTLAGKWI